MSGDNGNANFNEVLQITVDLKALGEQLTEARQMYEKFTSGMSDVGSTLFTSTSLTNSIREVFEQIGNLTASIVESNDRIANEMATAMQGMAALQEAMGVRQVEQSAKQAEQIVKQAEAKTEVTAAASEQAAVEQKVITALERQRQLESELNEIYSARFKNVSAPVDEERLAALKEEKRAIDEIVAANDRRVRTRDEALSKQQIEAAAIDKKAANDQTIAGLKEELALMDKQAALKKSANAETIANLKEELSLMDKQAALADKFAAATSKAFQKEYLQGLQEAYQRQQQADNDEEKKTRERIAVEEEADSIRSAFANRYLDQLKAISAQKAVEASWDKETIAGLEKAVAAQEREAQQQERLNLLYDRAVSVQERGQLSAVRGSYVDQLRQQADLLQQRLVPQLEKARQLLEEFLSLKSANAPLDQQETSLRRFITAQEEANRTQEKQRSVINAIDRDSQGFFEKFTANITGSIAHLARFFIEWTLILDAINAVKAVIEFPFKVLADGVSYLANIEQEADNIAGTLNANVKFSANLAENLRLSAESARGAAEALKDLSAKTGTPFEVLERLFNDLASTNATKSVKTVKDLVDVTEMFSLGLRGIGLRGVQLTRALSEVPKLFEGSLQANSQLLHSMNLTVAEAEHLVSSSREHKNLVEQLKGIFGPYLDAQAKAELHGAAIARQLEEQKKRLEGIVALPLYEQLVQFGTKLLEVLEKNKDLIRSIATEAGKMVELFLGPLNEFFNQITGSTQGLLTVVMYLEYAASQAIATFSGFVSLANIAVAAAKAMVPGSGTGMKDVEKEMKSFLDTQQKFADQQGRIAQNIENLKKGALPTAGPSALDQPFEGKDHPSTKNGASAAKADLQKELADLKEAYDEYKNTVKEKEASAVLSKREAVTQIKELNKEELAFAEFFTERYVEAVKQQNVSIEQQKTLALQAQTALVNFRKTLNNEDSSAQRAANKEAQDVAQSQAKTDLEMVKEQRKAELQLVNNLAQQGYITKVELIDKTMEIEKKASDQTIAEINTQLNSVSVLSAKWEEYFRAREKAEQEIAVKELLNTSQRQAAEQDETTKLESYVVKRLQQSNEYALSLERVTNALKNRADVLQDAFTLKDENITAEEKEIERQLRLARSQDINSESTRNLTLRLRELRNERTQLLESQINAINSSNLPLATRQVVSRYTLGQYQKDELRSGPQVGETDIEFMDRMKKLSEVIGDATPSFEKAFDSFKEKLFGFDIGSALGTAQSASDKFAISLEAGSNALQNLNGIINSIKNGFKQGGVLGGIGAGIGAFGDALSAIPVVGKFIPAIGGILSFVGGLFTAAAKRIAEDIKKNFQQTIDNYNNGNATLIDTLNTVERERQDAILRLSGQKGGKDQLDKLLPEFDKEITDLQNKQRQILGDFDTSLGALRLHSSTLSAVNKQWADINKQVRDYIGAGGDANKAAEFLSIQLQNIQQDAVDQLAQAEQDAIKDAQKLNDLLDQRNKLTDDFQKKQFDLINQDAIERKQVGAIARGKELADIQAEYQKNLDNINQEITLTQARVDKEKQVFTIASDISDLRARDNALNLLALDKEIAKWKDLQSIVKDIGVGPNGLFQSMGGVLIQPGGISVTITVPSGTDVSGVGSQVGGDIAAEINRRLRLSPNA